MTPTAEESEMKTEPDVVKTGAITMGHRTNAVKSKFRTIVFPE